MKKIYPNKEKFNEDLKQKLKLNLDVVKKCMLDEEIREDMIKIDNNILGYHDEFMSKFDEFSTSWKDQALKETKHH